MTQHHRLPGNNQPLSDATVSTRSFSAGSICPVQELDVTKRDRFELLSAYLDGEISSEERQLVQSWLASDPSAKCLYNRLLQLRRGFQNLSFQADCETDDILAGVIDGLNRRLRLALMAGGGVVIMGILSLLSGGVGPRSPLTQWASLPSDSNIEAKDVLRVALDEPAFPIPDTMSATTPVNGGILPSDSKLW